MFEENVSSSSPLSGMPCRSRVASKWFNANKCDRVSRWSLKDDWWRFLEEARSSFFWPIDRRRICYAFVFILIRPTGLTLVWELFCTLPQKARLESETKEYELRSPLCKRSIVIHWRTSRAEALPSKARTLRKKRLEDESTMHAWTTWNSLLSPLPSLFSGPTELRVFPPQRRLRNL